MDFDCDKSAGSGRKSAYSPRMDPQPGAERAGFRRGAALGAATALNKPMSARERVAAGAMRRAAALLVVAVAAAGCGSSSRDGPDTGRAHAAEIPSTHACVAAPQPTPVNRLLTSGTRLTVPVGAVVYVVLVEWAQYSGPGFPWRTPASSHPGVLARVRLCKLTGASSLPLTVTGFRAVRPGTATVSAPLTRRWQALKRRPKPQPAVDFVTVR